MSLLNETLRYLRLGLRNLLVVNLGLATITVLAASAYNPEASNDDLAVVVALPILLFYITVHALLLIPATRQSSTPAQQPVLSTMTRGCLAKMTLVVLGTAVLLAILAFDTALAVPGYALLHIDWAISGGLLAAFVLFGLSVLLVIGTLVPLTGMNFWVRAAQRLLYSLVPRSTVSKLLIRVAGML